MTWTAENVQAALTEAFVTLFSMPSPDRGTGTGAGFWPEHTYDQVEVDEMWRASVNDNVRPRVRPTPTQIHRMEIVLLGEGKLSGWLKEFLPAGAAKRCLTCAVLWEAFGRSMKRGCREKGWAYSTFRRRRDEGAQALADALNAAGASLP